MPHVVLLGDSIFDNGAYTRGGPDVVTQLREILPAPWRATLAAVDGATTQEFDPQRRALTSDVTHAVLSLGGNDALGHADLLDTRVRSSAEVLERFADLRLICNEPADYANPIEPSSHGGAKIARVIVRALELEPSPVPVARVLADA